LSTITALPHARRGVGNDVSRRNFFGDEGNFFQKIFRQVSTGNCRRKSDVSAAVNPVLRIDNQSATARLTKLRNSVSNRKEMP
jgi:hypothetical protein